MCASGDGMRKSFDYTVAVWNTKGTLCKTNFALLREARLYAEAMSATGKYMAFLSERRSGMEIGIYAAGKDIMTH